MVNFAPPHRISTYFHYATHHFTHYSCFSMLLLTFAALIACSTASCNCGPLDDDFRPVGQLCGSKFVAVVRHLSSRCVTPDPEDTRCLKGKIHHTFETKQYVSCFFRFSAQGPVWKTFYRKKTYRKPYRIFACLDAAEAVSRPMDL